MGQDESIFKAYAHSSRYWTVTGKKRLLPKSEGVGEMVSAVQDEWTGFGFNLTAEQLAKINAQRVIDKLAPFVDSPGIRYLEYGKNKEGYWDFEKFNEQVKDIIYCFNIIYPGYQLVLEVDHSSGHLKTKEDGLAIRGLSLGWGGAQRLMRDSENLPAECLGPAMTDYPGTPPYARLLQPGDTQHMQFQPGDPEPKFKSRTDKTGEYVGKAKGVLQILYERGLWKQGMHGSFSELDIQRKIRDNKPLPDPALDAPAVLAACRDFLNEKSLLETTLEERESCLFVVSLQLYCFFDDLLIATTFTFSLYYVYTDGHILLKSPKCHPELAGVGIEYSWGLAKMKFKREINDMVAKNLHLNISRALSTDILSTSQVHKFSRRTRDYRRIYEYMKFRLANKTFNIDSTSFQMLENMRKTYKTHRNIGEIEGKYIKQELEAATATNAL
jgi:hypothetical protein